MHYRYTRVLAIHRIMLAWKTYIVMKPTNSPTQGHPNLRKKGLKIKSGVWATFSHIKYFFVGRDWFYRKQTTRNPTQPNSPQTRCYATQRCYNRRASFSRDIFCISVFRFSVRAETFIFSFKSTANRHICCPWQLRISCMACGACCHWASEAQSVCTPTIPGGYMM